MEVLVQTFCEYCKLPTDEESSHWDCFQEIYEATQTTPYYEESHLIKIVGGDKNYRFRLCYMFKGHHVLFFCYDTLVAVLYERELTIVENVFSLTTDKYFRILADMLGNNKKSKNYWTMDYENVRQIPIHAFRSFLALHNIVDYAMDEVDERYWFGKDQNALSNCYIRDSRLVSYRYSYFGREDTLRSKDLKPWIQYGLDMIKAIEIDSKYTIYMTYNRTSIEVKVWLSDKYIYSELHKGKKAIKRCLSFLWSLN